MSLARVKTWNAGDTLTAADLNAEFNNILNNPRSLINSMTGAAGDVWTATAANTWSSLAIGAASQVLGVSAGLPAWTTRGLDSRVMGLVGANNATTPNTKLDVSADAVVLRNTTDSSTVIQTNTGTITNDTGLAGPAANGRDQAAAFTASSWIHFYFIWNGATLATLSSTVAPPTGPTLPTGYTHWAYIGAVRYNATPVLVATRLRGSLAFPDVPLAAISGGTATVETAVSLTTLVPPNALTYELGGNGTNTGGGSTTLTLRIVTGSNFSSYTLPLTNLNPTTVPVFVEMPNVSQQLFYLWAGAVTGGITLDVQAYRIPNGDS